MEKLENTNFKLNHNKILCLKQKINNINWQNSIRTSSNYYRYWLHYKHSITNVLKPYNFQVKVLYNQKLQGIWHRHVILYAFNRPFIYAVTHTKSPHAFGLSGLGGNSLGNLLFKNNIHKGNFVFCSTKIVSFLNLYTQNKQSQVMGRKRIYTKKNAELILYEFLL